MRAFVRSRISVNCARLNKESWVMAIFCQAAIAECQWWIMPKCFAAVGNDGSPCPAEWLVTWLKRGLVLTLLAAISVLKVAEGIALSPQFAGC